MSKPETDKLGQGVPKWLKNVQSNSWEPEILLSGLVLIGLFQLPSKIENFAYYFASEVSYNSWIGIFQILQLTVYFLIFGLALHLFLRSVWVGLIGLTYTFPKGIKPEKLGFKQKFEERVKRLPTLESQIISLEKVCSSIFAICFFLMMVIIGVVVASLFWIIFLYGVGWILEVIFGWDFLSFINPYFDRILSYALIIVAIDFITLGIYRKNKYTAKLYYPIHRFIGWITLSRVYRPVYYLLASNVKKFYLILFLGLFLLSTVLGQRILDKRPDNNMISQLSFYAVEANALLFSGYYRDRNKEWESQMLEIPSPLLKDRFLELTVKNRISFEREMEKYCGINGLKVDAEIKLECVNRFMKVYIDKKQVEGNEWFFYFFQESKRKGFISYIDTDGLAPGRHNLEVKLNSDPVSTIGYVIFIKE